MPAGSCCGSKLPPWSLGRRCVCHGCFALNIWTARGWQCDLDKSSRRLLNGSTPPRGKSHKLFVATALRGIQPGSETPIPGRAAEGFDVAVDEADVAALGVAKVRAAPVWIARGGDAAVAGRVVLGIVDNPGAGFVGGFCGDASFWVGGGNGLGA